MSLRSTSTRSFISLILGAVLLVHGAARADGTDPRAIPEPPPANVLREMQQHDERAAKYYHDGKYDLALKELEAAFELGHDPDALFSMAQCHRRAGRYRKALALFRRYVETQPNSSLRLETEDKIQDLLALIEKQEQIEREKRRPLWKKPWFWGVLASAAAVAGSGLAIGLSLGLRDRRDVVEPTF